MPVPWGWSCWEAMMRHDWIKSGMQVVPVAESEMECIWHSEGI